MNNSDENKENIKPSTNSNMEPLTNFEPLIRALSESTENFEQFSE